MYILCVANWFDVLYILRTKTNTFSLVSTRTTLKRNISICQTSKSKWQ